MAFKRRTFLFFQEIKVKKHTKNVIKKYFFFPEAFNILRIIALEILINIVHTTSEIRGKNIKTTFSAFVSCLCVVWLRKKLGPPVKTHTHTFNINVKLTTEISSLRTIFDKVRTRTMNVIIREWRGGIRIIN